MSWIVVLIAVIAGYLIGSIPFGLLIVKLKTGQDLRQIGSGRTGGTNAARAAGFWAGLATATLDILKVTVAVWVARWMTGGNGWAEALAGVTGVLGHNNSIFMAKRVVDAAGKARLVFEGGAGGASAVGGALGLWPLSPLLILPFGLFFLFVVGYASVATLSVGLAAILVFALRAAFFGGPWEHVAYGVLTLGLQYWALRPNVQRLFEGNERVFNKSLRARYLARQTAAPEEETD